MYDKRSPTVAIITNGYELCDVLLRIAREVFGPANVLGTTYDRCEISLPRLMAECDFFILELIRDYRGAQRAEGVVLGETLVKLGKEAMIFSHFCISQHIGSQSYWDVGDCRSPAQAMVDGFGKSVEGLREFEKLTSYFSDLLRIPPQHNSELSDETGFIEPYTR